MRCCFRVGGDTPDPKVSSTFARTQFGRSMYDKPTLSKHDARPVLRGGEGNYLRQQGDHRDRVHEFDPAPRQSPEGASGSPDQFE